MSAGRQIALGLLLLAVTYAGVAFALAYALRTLP